MQIKVVYVKAESTGHFELELTIGKIYDAYYDDTEPVYSSTGFYYKILNDLGVEKQYYYGYFVTLEKYRESKISEIFENKTN